MPEPKKAGGALAAGKETEMSSREIDQFLTGRWVARLATNGASGYPHIAPLWYYWDGRKIYLSLTERRASLRNLDRDPRCAIIIDMDDRPLMGVRDNWAKAVLIFGKAVKFAKERELGSDHVGQWFEQGPLAEPMSIKEALHRLTDRYALSERDGAIGFQVAAVHKMIRDPAASDSEVFKQNAGRILVTIEPERIRTWDFSKAPLEYADEEGEHPSSEGT